VAEGVVASPDGHSFRVRGLSPRQEQAQRVDELLDHGNARHLLGYELTLASELQSALLPRVLPRDGSVEMSARTFPCRVLSGDFYEYLPLDSTRFGLALGDATGKGLPAALLAAQVQALLRAGFAAGLPGLMATLNAHLLALGDKARCVTLFCGVYERSSGRLEYVNAGHNPAILMRRDGSSVLLETGGALLGALPDARYEVGTALLRAGDSLLVYSDGLSETFSVDGEPYGEARVRAVVSRLRSLAADQMLQALEADANAFRGAASAQDDLTLLLLKRP
jgi:sigma-B regulation protein RsbU (phosphoserine phosphatase)